MKRTLQSETPRFRTEEKNRGGVRKPYRAPRIETLGRLRDLTRGASVGGILDGGATSAY